MSEEPLERSRAALDDARQAADEVAATEPFGRDDEPETERRTAPEPQVSPDEDDDQAPGT